MGCITRSHKIHVKCVLPNKSHDNNLSLLGSGLLDQFQSISCVLFVACGKWILVSRISILACIKFLHFSISSLCTIFMILIALISVAPNSHSIEIKKNGIDIVGFCGINAFDVNFVAQIFANRVLSWNVFLSQSRFGF